MKKVRCISLDGKLIFWHKYFRVGDVVELVNDYMDGYEVKDPDQPELMTWLVDKECFEEVCDE